MSPAKQWKFGDAGIFDLPALHLSALTLILSQTHSFTLTGASCPSLPVGEREKEDQPSVAAATYGSAGAKRPGEGDSLELIYASPARAGTFLTLNPGPGQTTVRDSFRHGGQAVPSLGMT